MDHDDLNVLDSAIARREGFKFAICAKSGRVMRPDHSPYAPTRCEAEAARLIEKYIKRVSRLDDGNWVAVALSGRAHVGPTLPIAVCRAVAES